MESIHGHEVIEMIVSAGRPFTRSGLVAEVCGKYGEDARFHTCSAEGMTATELVEFLMAKGKFHIAEEGMMIDPSKVCQH
jgi:probable metal-binding protein